MASGHWLSSSTDIHTKAFGRRLFELACKLDLEGIVAKRADSLYEQTSNSRSWIKIKNPKYQSEGRAWGFVQANGVVCQPTLGDDHGI